jgi:hypothetical protein
LGFLQNIVLEMHGLTLLVVGAVCLLSVNGLSWSLVSKTTQTPSFQSRNSQLRMADDKNKPVKTGLDRIKGFMEAENKKDPSQKLPPIYEPGSYPQRALAAAVYLIPIVDAFDLGKFMFEAYPELGELYNLSVGPLAAVYNAVPFLPFAIFFALSYIARAPTFPVEIRFHCAQAFMISLVGFLPSLTFPFLEKAGVPGMAVLYNTGQSLPLIYSHIISI